MDDLTKQAVTHLTIEYLKKVLEDKEALVDKVKYERDEAYFNLMKARLERAGGKK